MTTRSEGFTHNTDNNRPLWRFFYTLRTPDMIIPSKNGRFIFTPCSLNLGRQFVSFHEGMTRTCVKKLAAACAAEMR